MVRSSRFRLYISFYLRTAALMNMLQKITAFFITHFFITLSFAQPKGIHLSWNGNQVNTSSTMAITWLNDIHDDGIVQYGSDSNHLIKRAKATEVFSENLKSYVSKSTLTNLSAITWYYYRVGSGEHGWSKTYRFRTGPPKGSSSKMIIGIWSDTQNNEGNLHFEQTDSIVSQMKKDTYYFTIHNGDIVENGSIMNNWKGYFDAGQPVNANEPLMSVTGNHDVNNDTSSTDFQKPFPVFYEVMNLPGNQLNYSYDYGNVHFIAINSGWAQGAEKVGKVLFNEHSPEYRWLEADLAKARLDKKINWIIIYSHYPVYSFGFSHIPTWQAHIKPLVDKYKVDLYLAGHRHVYERHKAVRGTEIFESDDTDLYGKPKGTVYVTNGSCGGSLQGLGGWDLPTMMFTPTEKMYTHAVMTIENKTLTYRVTDKSGKEIDHFTIRK
jgi:predicted phosphodiesterase